MNIKLGFGSASIEDVAHQHNINPDVLVLILNLFSNEDYYIRPGKKYNYLPDILMYLRNSHAYFLNDKIPDIQKNIQQLVHILDDAKANMVAHFYTKYIEEITEHMEYENNIVFPYIEKMQQAYHKKKINLNLKEYNIGIYGDHHDDIEDTLKDLKNILIRHLPVKNDGRLRTKILQQLFELESDLSSHTRIENEILIPLTKNLEDELHSLSK